ncbi:MAG: DUF3224 domain-containing protein [Candidatus Bathyarchaeota archaeon]
MKKKTTLLTVFALTAVMLPTICIGMVNASASRSVSGTVMIIGYEELEILPKGNSDNIVMKVLLTAMFTGDIQGITTYEAIWIIHNREVNFGANMHEKITFDTATVLGQSGSLTIEANMGSGRPADSVWHWTITGGTGALTNLHGQGTWAPENPGDFIEYYEGQLHFDP